MANSPTQINLQSESITELLARAVSDGNYGDILQALKYDDPGEEAAASDIRPAAGQLWSNLVDDFILAVHPYVYRSTKLWGVATDTERDDLGSTAGLTTGDVAWVESLGQFWAVVSVDGAASSTWSQITGATNTIRNGWAYTYSAATGDSDPGAGTLRLNQADPDNATFIYFNDDTLDGTGLEDFALTIGADTRVYVQQVGSPANNKLYIVAGPASFGGGYWRLPVTLSAAAQGSDMATGQPVLVQIIPISATLSGVLARGNTTGGMDIVQSTGDALVGAPVMVQSTTDDTLPTLCVASTDATPGIHAGTRAPDGIITANPGDYYMRAAGTSSRLYQYRGAATGNTGWVELGAGGAGGGETLAQTLALGSASGGTDITLSSGDALRSVVGEAVAITSPDPDTTPVAVLESEGANGATCHVFSGTREPTGFVTANPGSLYVSTDGTSSRLYQYQGATPGNTTWVELGAGGGGGGETFAQTLALGNVTGGNDITLTSGDAIRTATTVQLETTAADSVAITQWDVQGAGGATVRFFAGANNPVALRSGNPGDYYMRVGGVNSRLYQHRGVAANTTDWVDIGATPDFSSVLAAGNSTNGEDIIMGFGDVIRATGTGSVDIQSPVGDVDPIYTFVCLGSNAKLIAMYAGSRDPEGIVSTVEGALYVRGNGTSSRLYQFRGVSAGSTGWVEIGAGGGGGGETLEQTLAIGNIADTQIVSNGGVTRNDAVNPVEISQGNTGHRRVLRLRSAQTGDPAEIKVSVGGDNPNVSSSPQDLSGDMYHRTGVAGASYVSSGNTLSSKRWYMSGSIVGPPWITTNHYYVYSGSGDRYIPAPSSQSEDGAVSANHTRWFFFGGYRLERVLFWWSGGSTVSDIDISLHVNFSQQASRSVATLVRGSVGLFDFSQQSNLTVSLQPIGIRVDTSSSLGNNFLQATWRRA